MAGFPVGILALDTRHQLVLGNVQHAGSFTFPVLYEIVRDVSGPALMRGDADAVSAFQPILALQGSLDDVALRDGLVASPPRRFTSIRRSAPGFCSVATFLRTPPRSSAQLGARYSIC
jgi:hypothetical protein